MEDFHTLQQIIQNRRAVFPKSYDSRKIPDELIAKILEAGNWAPTHKRTEPWRYIVMKGEALQKLSDFIYDDYFKSTPPDRFSDRKAEKKRNNPLKSGAVIAICLKRHEVVPEWEEIASVAMSVQNIWLSCSSLNIGCYWSSPDVIHRMNDFLGLREDERCIGLFYMGYLKDEVPPGTREPMGDKVRWME